MPAGEASPPGPSAIPAHVREFLAAPRFAALATLDEDGSPRQAFIWYDLDGDTLLINSRRERHWPRHVERDPRIHLAVRDDASPYHWVGLTGRAELLRQGDAATEDILALARRYGRDPDRYRGQDRVTFRVHIERAYEYRD